MTTATDRRQGVNSSVAIKAPCKAATTANITLSGEQTIDGVSCVTGDRVLVKNQTDGSENGIYDVDTSSWTRSPDWDGSYDVQQGTMIRVTQGTANIGTWTVSTSSITIGTTSVTIAQTPDLSEKPTQVATLAALKALDISAATDGESAVVAYRATSEDGGGGVFYWDSSDLSTEVTNDSQSGIYAPPDSDSTGASGAWVRFNTVLVDIRAFGAISGGVTDCATALTGAIAQGVRLTGAGLTYAIDGNISLLANTYIENATFKQLSPDAAGNVRTLTSSSVNNITLIDVKVDRNGDGTNGDIALDAGIWISGGSNHHLERVEVTGDDIGSGIVLTNCTDPTVKDCYVHDIDYSLGADPGDDRVQGIWMDACTNISYTGNRVNDIGGNYGSGATTEHSRAHVFGGTDGGIIQGNIVKNSGQGFDFTGSVGNNHLSVMNNHAENSFSFGFKFANTAHIISIIGNVAEDSGYAGFVWNENGSAPNSKQYQVIGCISVNAGYNGEWTASNPAGFLVLATGNLPEGVQFIGCRAIDNQGSPTMVDGFRNQTAIAATGQGFVEAIHCTVEGETTKQFNGMNVPSCYLTRSSALSHTTSGAWEVVTWNEEQHDYAIMHSTSANTEIVTIRRTGFYAVNCAIVFAASATGDRRIRLLQEGSGIGRTIEDYKNNNGASLVTLCQINTAIWCTEGDELKIEAYQDSGGALNINNTRSYLQVYEVNGYGGNI